MAVWRPQSYQQRGRQLNIAPTILDHAVASGEETIAVDPRLPPIFTLRHLAFLTDVEYGLLRDQGSP
jgi:RNA-directed DNA polymerase